MKSALDNINVKVRMPKVILLPTLKCNQCGHTWWPRRPVMPKICPVCKRRNYAEPKAS